MKVENGSITAWPSRDFLHARKRSEMAHDWEIHHRFMRLYNIEPNLLNCIVCITAFNNWMQRDNAYPGLMS